MMKWVNIKNKHDLMVLLEAIEYKIIIVEDEYGRIGQAFKNGEALSLETFGQISFDIDFGEIRRYIILDN